MWLYLVITFVTLMLIYIKIHYKKWQRLGIEYDEPYIPYGSLAKVVRKEKHLGITLHDIYCEKTKAKIVGLFMFFRPVLLIRDAVLARKILTSDFNSFHDRGLYVDEKNNPLSGNLFVLPGQRWRLLRTKLTPAFTSGKLKGGMFEIIDEVGNKLTEHIKHIFGKGEDIVKTFEMKTMLTTYAIDVIGSVIFGLDIDSFAQPNNEFRILSNQLLNESTTLQKFFIIMRFCCPPVAKFLVFMGINDNISYPLRDIVKRTIEYREKNNINRKDLLQLLIQLRNTGKISDDTDKLWNIETSGKAIESMSIDQIAAQAFLFYVAGTETTAATAAYTIYELAMNPVILERVQSEVDQCLLRHELQPDGKLTYAALQDMKYLDLCIMETTRKYPGLPFLNRVCTQDYKIAGTDFMVTKGTPIIIPLFSLHRDDRYFPDPMKYEPNRFSENSASIAFMPFGEGPRHCIAQRLGVLNVKVALVKILSNFQIETMQRKEVEFVHHHSPALVPKDGLNVRLHKR
uniref:Cytochrome P450 n=1 Tax=Glossina brevipalpis TaxID=37001 RepID=A0A240SWD3_9MUSC